MEISLMAKPDSKKPETAVRVEGGDTLSAIAKANKTTVAKLLELNPVLKSNPKYQGGNRIFSNTLINIAPAKPKTEPDVRGDNPPGGEIKPEEDKKDKTPADQPPAGGGPIEQPVIPQTVSPSGNISTAGEEAPTYTPPVLSAAEILAVQQAKEAETNRLNAIDVLKERFAQYGLQSLATVIKDLAAEGASEATIGFALKNTPEYKERFKANDLRLKKGLAVLSAGEYIALEDTYRQVLRAYGLRQFDNDLYVSQFIANDVSPTELTARVQTATERVLNASPEVANTLKSYYNLGAQDLVAYALDPESQLSEIQNKITAAEIGTAAFAQGLGVNKTTAEELRMQGVTQEQAQKGYATIADILPGAQKLSEIYGGMDAYGQVEAQKEVFGGLASEKRKREKLTQTEIGTFSGKSGVSRGTLGTETRGAF